jgi:hypothetical protein
VPTNGLTFKDNWRCAFCATNPGPKNASGFSRYTPNAIMAHYITTFIANVALQLHDFGNDMEAGVVEVPWPLDEQKEFAVPCVGAMGPIRLTLPGAVQREAMELEVIFEVLMRRANNYLAECIRALIPTICHFACKRPSSSGGRLYDTIYVMSGAIGYNRVRRTAKDALLDRLFASCSRQPGGDLFGYLQHLATHDRTLSMMTWASICNFMCDGGFCLGVRSHAPFCRFRVRSPSLLFFLDPSHISDVASDVVGRGFDVDKVDPVFGFVRYVYTLTLDAINQGRQEGGQGDKILQDYLLALHPPLRE